MKMTAKTFEGDLLAVLNEMSNGAPGKEFPHNTVIDNVLSRMDMTRDSLGERNGKPLAPTLIGQAFQKLRKKNEPLTLSTKKGSWGLTLEGTSGVSAEAIPQPAPPIVEVEVADVYADPVIRRLVTAETPCFGLKYDPSKICAGCPLKQECAQKSFEAWRKVSEALDATDHRRHQEKLNPPKKKPPKRVAQSANKAEMYRKKLLLTENDVRSRIILSNARGTAACEFCQGMIEEDAQFAHIANRGSYHLDCFAKLSADLGEL